MDIGNRLEKARKAIGYTQEKVFELTGIGKSSLSAYENNEREPRFSDLSRLAETYKRSIDFFLIDNLPAESVMLWRDPPEEGERKSIESDFVQLCEQYHNLELCTDERRTATLPQPDVINPEQFSWSQAESFARKVHTNLCLGDIPSTSLKKILEERYYIKIFYLKFAGSAVSTVSEEFGPAVLLNSRNVSWRRNYDLAHELFHLLTWKIFRSKGMQPNENEEKLANSFAGKLLMPEESLKQRIASLANEQGAVRLEQLDDLAREFGVSLDAMVYRIAYLFKINKKDTKQYLAAAQQLAELHKPRESNNPGDLPGRYCDLAYRALREGKLSLMQFAKYVGISYKDAQEFMTEDEDFKDGKMSIPVA